MKKYSFLAALLIMFGSCNIITGKRETGNGNIRTEKRSTDNFNAVETSGSINTEISTGDSYTVSVENDDNLLQYIVTEVRNGSLSIYYKDGYSIDNDHAKVYVTAPSLYKIATSGSADINTQGILKNPRQIEISASGSGDIKGQIDAPSCTVGVSGSGSVTLSGRTKDFDCSASGSGDINCSALQSENAKIEISGSGNAHVFASVRLTASTNGSGDIYYTGSPATEIHTNGSGTVTQQK